MIQLAAIIREFAAMQLLHEYRAGDLFCRFSVVRECLILSCAELMKSFPNPWPHPFMKILGVSNLYVQ